MLHSLLSQKCLLLELASVYTTKKQCQLPPGGISRKVLEDLRMHTSYSESKVTMKSFLHSFYGTFLNFPKHNRNSSLKLCVDSLPACERVWEVLLGFWLSTAIVKYKNRKYKIIYPGNWKDQKDVVQQNHQRPHKVNMGESHGCGWTSLILLLLSTPIKISFPPSLTMNTSTTRKNAWCQHLLATEYNRTSYSMSDVN